MGLQNSESEGVDEVMGRYKKLDISNCYLRSIIKYDKSSGLFYWIKPPSNRVRAGDVAGSKEPNGYIIIGVNGTAIQASRLAWFYVKGVWPPKMVDHINLNRSDNRWINLRLASNAQNKCNSKKHKDNKSGYKGVFWEKGCKKWRVQIHADGRRVHVGVYKNLIDAARAYDAAAIKFHGAFCNLNFNGGQNRKA